MSETKETKPEVTQPVASEGGEMKMKSKPKPKKFKATKEEPVKIDLSKVETDSQPKIGCKTTCIGSSLRVVWSKKYMREY